MADLDLTLGATDEGKLNEQLQRVVDLLGQIETNTEKVDRGSGDTTRKMKSDWERMKDLFHTIGGNLMNIEAGFRLAERAGRMLIAPIEAAAQRESQIRQLAFAANNVGINFDASRGRVDAFAARLADATIASRDQVYEIMQTLITQGDGVDVTLEQIETGTERVVDMMTLSGRSAEEGARVVSAAMAGNLEAVGEFVRGARPQLQEFARTHEDIGDRAEFALNTLARAYDNGRLAISGAELSLENLRDTAHEAVVAVGELEVEWASMMVTISQNSSPTSVISEGGSGSLLDVGGQVGAINEQLRAQAAEQERLQREEESRRIREGVGSQWGGRDAFATAGNPMFGAPSQSQIDAAAREQVAAEVDAYRRAQEEEARSADTGRRGGRGARDAGISAEDKGRVAAENLQNYRDALFARDEQRREKERQSLIDQVDAEREAEEQRLRILIDANQKRKDESMAAVEAEKAARAAAVETAFGMGDVAVKVAEVAGASQEQLAGMAAVMEFAKAAGAFAEMNFVGGASHLGAMAAYIKAAASGRSRGRGGEGAGSYAGGGSGPPAASSRLSQPLTDNRDRERDARPGGITIVVNTLTGDHRIGREVGRVLNRAAEMNSGFTIRRSLIGN